MALKQPIQGFLDRGGEPNGPQVTNFVVQCKLSELWNGSVLIHPNPLDTALADGNTWPIKLRASAATGAPSSMKTIGGFTPVTVTDPASGSSGTVGPFWSPAYATAYAAAQTALGNFYDSAPRLREIVMAMMALVFDEPFRFYNQSQLTVAGLNLTDYENSWAAMYTAHKNAWATTLQDLACNPAGYTLLPAGWVETQITAARAALGLQAVIGNNSMRVADQGAAYDTMYTAIQTAGPPTYFQTATYSSPDFKMGDPATAFQKAVNYGANSVELPGGYHTSIPSAVLTTYEAELIANPLGEGGSGGGALNIGTLNAGIATNQPAITIQSPGSTLVALVTAHCTTPSTQSGGSTVWTRKASVQPNATETVEIWTTRSVSVSDTIPTWAFAGGSQSAVVLVELNEARIADQTGTSTGTTSPLVITASGTDGGPGRVVIVVAGLRGTAGTATISDSISGTTPIGNDGLTSQASHHFSSYTITDTTGVTADTDTVSWSAFTSNHTGAAMISFALPTTLIAAADTASVVDHATVVAPSLVFKTAADTCTVSGLKRAQGFETTHAADVVSGVSLTSTDVLADTAGVHDRVGVPDVALQITG